MVGGDLPEHEGVVDDGPEGVDGAHQHLARRHPHHGGVVGGVEAEEHVVPPDRRQLRQHAVEGRRPHLRAAPAAAHRRRRDRLQVVRTGQARRDGGAGVGAHLRQVGVLGHEPAVDPVLPAPHQGALDRPRAASADRVAVSGGHQGQEPALGAEGPGAAPEEDAAQVTGERGALAHREHPGLLARMPDHRRDVAGREHVGMRRRPQRVVDPEEALVVDREAGRAGPGRGPGLRHPEDLVERHRRAVAEDHGPVAHRGHRLPQVHVHAPRPQHALEAPPRAGVVGGQNRLAGPEQVHLGDRPVRPRQQLPQGELHRQQQLDPPGPRPHHPDANRHAGGQDTGAQPRPPLDEAADGLDGYRRLGRPRHAAERGGGADVDRQQVPGHRRAPLAVHLAPVEVEPHGRLVVEAGAREPGQPREVDVHLVERVVAGHQARQHPRVGRMDVARDQGDAHPGHRAHAEPLEHRDVGVPAPDQHEVLDDGHGGVVHQLGLRDALARTRAAAPANTSGSGSRLSTRNASRGKSKK